MSAEEKFIHFLHNLRQHRKQPHGSHTRVEESDGRGAYELFQSSTINALLKGAYDGDMTFGQLRQHGDFGLGTFNRLDGEMVALNGIFFRIKADGIAYPVNDKEKTPFAVVQFFKPDFQEELDREMEYGQVKSFLQEELPESNLFYAIRIDGLFTRVEARSVPQQDPPYPPLSEVVKTQPVFEMFNIKGSLIGFRFPDFAQGVNVPGYHLHFINEERNAGGHVLEFHLKNGRLSVEHTSSFHMELPRNGSPTDTGFTPEQQEDIKRVEE
jgi:acetolactate decarboxylase